ncbi:hypothetical protein CBER1_03812 [Cercospora berteroae]|uniref:Autophagy-related protein n=1 Tax=Cercospora berteroae TaxID=357750 RepID=A0A2S6C821_9PEZI|nr:hypothetical protein CBER1_03812 [Cercospora berteroae]
MISEITPRGKEFLFFSLFSIVGKTSSFIGPFISSAIIDATDGNNSSPFYFLFALSLASFVFFVFVCGCEEEWDGAGGVFGTEEEVEGGEEGEEGGGGFGGLIIGLFDIE